MVKESMTVAAGTRGITVLRGNAAVRGTMAVRGNTAGKENYGVAEGTNGKRAVSVWWDAKFNPKLVSSC